MPGMLWRSWKDWTTGCRCGMQGASSLPSRRHPSPASLRNGHGRSGSVPVPPSGVGGLGERWTATLKPLQSRSEDDKDPSMIIDDVATAGKPAATSARKLTFLQK